MGKHGKKENPGNTEKTIEEKLNELSPANLIRFYDERKNILCDRQSSLLYGIALNNFPYPTKEEMRSLNEKLYKEMFG
jgi:hypothetical protein